jgi:hypothetical protein
MSSCLYIQLSNLYVLSVHMILLKHSYPESNPASQPTYLSDPSRFHINLRYEATLRPKLKLIILISS